MRARSKFLDFFRTRGIALAAAAAVLPVDPSTWKDHDRVPIPEPAVREQNLYGHEFHEAIIEPLSHTFDIPDKLLALFSLIGPDTEEESVNVNEFDEVPNSTWFTNRNHVRSMTTAEIIHGAAHADVRPKPPYVIKSIKKTGVNPGFNIKDAAGRRWVVKFDPPSHPQLGSGADAVVSRLLYAAGYNISHDVPFTFKRADLTIDPDLADPKDGSLPYSPDMLDSLLTRGAFDGNGRHFGQASLFLEGKPVGNINFRGRRSDDANDIFKHQNRRELRGLYVLVSWLGSWDTKNHQSLDMFIEDGDSLGYVRHNLLDVGASLGAAAEGPKLPRTGYEYRIDFDGMVKRIYTLGFTNERWRKAKQETGVASVGNFTAEYYEPNKFKPLQPHPAFRDRTDRDCYWGAKLVASFSDAQIEAAIVAAGYEDPRALPILKNILIQRRDATMRYWFARVAPLDFFHVDGTQLNFSDLAVDRRIASARPYDVLIHDADVRIEQKKIEIPGTSFDLARLPANCKEVELILGIRGSNAATVTVQLQRKGSQWTLTHVRHA